MNWTVEQKKAIQDRNHTMLLSAAAGSGKTAVLTQRIIEELQDSKKPLDLTRLLAVTFTRNAASEMRQRISEELEKKLETDPNNAFYIRQLQLLPTAQISTIDSFFYRVVARYGSKIGVPIGFRTMEPNEEILLQEEVMQELVEDAFEGDVQNLDCDAFLQFANRFLNLGEEHTLFGDLLKLYKKVESYKEGISIFQAFEKLLSEEEQKPYQENMFWKTSIEEYQKRLKSALNKWNAYYTEVALPSNQLKSAEIDRFKKLIEECTEGINGTTLEQLASYYPKPKYSDLIHKGEIQENCSQLIDAIRKIIKEKVDFVYSYTAEDWSFFLSETKNACHVFGQLFQVFEERYFAVCKRKNALGFGQISRFAYQLLVEDDGQRTTVAEALKEEYDLICVDEYQDVNPLQHAIFEAISTGTNLFLVGDIKQAIYRFRHADPSIFSKLRTTFTPLYAIDEKTQACSHYMSENFRSDECVIDFCNQTFKVLFGYGGRSISYSSVEDPLRFAKTSIAASRSKIELTWFNSKKALKRMAEEQPSEEETETSQDQEVLYTGYRIAQLLKNGKRADGKTPLKPDDIVILMRSIKDCAMPYATMLNSIHVPFRCPESKSLFMNNEVLIALALLNSIDNPCKDVYLIATLISPLYRFQFDEIVDIRKAYENREDPFYFAFQAYYEQHPEDTRAELFFRQHRRFSKYAEKIPVRELMQMIFQETPLLSIAGADHVQSAKNLKMLYYYANTYAGANYAGLFGFLIFLNKESSRTDVTFPTPQEQVQTSTVTIMSIHKSKGLQFPVVFLVNCGKEFHDDGKEPILCSHALGIGLNFNDPEYAIKQQNPIRMALENEDYRATLEEELRILYVALTRAEERLFISGTVNGNTSKEKLLAKMEQASYALDEATIFDQKSYMQWFLLCKYDLSLVQEIWDPVFDPEAFSGEMGSMFSSSTETEQEETTFEMYQDRFGWSYNRDIPTKVPKKVTISQVERDLAYAFSNFDLLYMSEATKKRRPIAYLKEVDPKATERGTATHAFFEYCDFKNLRAVGLKAELQRLKDKNALPKDIQELIRVRELELFEQSKLFDILVNAQKIRREFRFDLTVDGTIFAEKKNQWEELEGEQVFIQGVIDAIVEQPDGSIVLVDYKTDQLQSGESITDFENRLRNIHSRQVYYYAYAIELMFHQKPKAVYIYPTTTGNLISIDVESWAKKHLYNPN